MREREKKSVEEGKGREGRKGGKERRREEERESEKWFYGAALEGEG